MTRTRKWIFVAQEAARLAELGLTPRVIAKRLGVAKSTITRWIAAGKVPKPATSRPRRDRKTTRSVTRLTPNGWASRVRADYSLDATDEQLVTLGVAALTSAHDRKTPLRVRLTAMGRFQAIVKQLALVTRQPPEEEPIAPAPPPSVPAAEAPRQPREDPRAKLLVN